MITKRSFTIILLCYLLLIQPCENLRLNIDSMKGFAESSGALSSGGGVKDNKRDCAFSCEPGTSRSKYLSMSFGDKKSMADSRSTFNVHVKMLVTDVYDFSDIEQDDLLRKGQVMSRAQTVAVPMVSRLASPFNEIVS